MDAMLTPNVEYYQFLRAAVFGDTDWKLLSRQARGKPKASFQLDREFSDTSAFIAYDFLVELYQNFGKPVVPIGIDSGCINISTRIDEFQNDHGEDIRYLMLINSEFHDLFRRFGVQAIFLHAFPSGGQERLANIDCHVLKVDNNGIPKPH